MSEQPASPTTPLSEHPGQSSSLPDRSPAALRSFRNPDRETCRRATEEPQKASQGFARQDWAPTALLLFLDVASWFVIYGFTSLVRGDAYYSSAFVFFIIDLLQITIIVMALFTIGGYDRSTETRSLVYATEHLLAIIAAGVVSAALIYSAASFDSTMKPSRGVVLVSFIIFLPVSLEYRRWLRRPGGGDDRGARFPGDRKRGTGPAVL